MKRAHLGGITTDDLRAMIRVATAMAAGRSARFPVETQIRALANTVTLLRALLELCAEGDPDALLLAMAIAAPDDEEEASP